MRSIAGAARRISARPCGVNTSVLRRLSARNLPSQQAPNLQALDDLTDRRTVEADRPCERRLVDTRAVPDHDERTVLRRRQLIGCALLDENANGDLMRAPQQESGAGVKVLERNWARHAAVSILTEGLANREVM